MSEPLDDPRLRQGSDLALDAEKAEADGDATGGRALYAQAAALYVAAARDLTSLPRLRAVLAVSGVCLAARGGRFDRAIEYAERFLAEPGSLDPEGAEELETLLRSYRRALPEKDPEAPAPPKEHLLYRSRQETRERAGRAAA
ncbi:MAG: hypothetical protein HY909_17940 [Deltaproteobacteria bacterium]|nr:hypothetical protein [Deltaproteobacteria bacterium]